MRALERLREIEPAWSGLGVTLAALLVLLLLRRLLPSDQRQRGRAAFVLLLVALGLRLLAIALVDWAGIWVLRGILGVLHVVALVAGLTGLASLVVFDLGLNRHRVRVPSILRNLVQFSVVSLVLLWMWSEATQNLSSLITATAVLGVLGLALQGTIANLFAGLSLQAERAFAIGEWIKAGDAEGRILEVRWRATLLLTKDGDTIVLPNARLVSGEVVNFSRPSGAHRVWLRLGLHHRHPPNLVKQVLLDAVRSVPDVLPFPEPDCFPVEFGDSAIVYAVRYWIADFERDVVIDGEVRTRLWYAANRAGLEMPFPTRTILLPDGTADVRSDPAEALARHELFAPLDAADRRRLADETSEVFFAAGELIVRQNDPGDSLYLVVAGEVSVRLAVGGAEAEVARLRAGDVFGEMSLLTGDPRHATCAARTDVTCRVITRDAFGHLLEARPGLADELSSLLATRQLELDGQREELSNEAYASRRAETRSRFLARIKGAFRLR